MNLELYVYFNFYPNFYNTNKSWFFRLDNWKWHFFYLVRVVILGDDLMDKCKEKQTSDGGLVSKIKYCRPWQLSYIKYAWIGLKYKKDGNIIDNFNFLQNILSD